MTGSEVAQTVMGYDGLGQVITQTDTLSRKTVTQYDQLGRPLEDVFRRLTISDTVKA